MSQIHDAANGTREEQREQETTSQRNFKPSTPATPVQKAHTAEVGIVRRQERGLDVQR